MTGSALSIALGAGPAWAVAVGIDRPVVHELVTPGQILQGQIELFNPGDRPAKISIYLLDWAYNDTGDGSRQETPPGYTERSSASWISVSSPRVEIAPKGKTPVEYTIRVPVDASLSGGYYAILSYEADAGQVYVPEQITPDNRAIYINYAAKLTTMFLIEMRDSANASGRLDDVSVAMSRTLTPGFSPVLINGFLVNNGNVVDRCESGSFHIQTPDGSLAARGELPPRYAWMGQRVPFRAEWNGSLTPGAYQVVFTYDCGNVLLISGEASLQVP